MASASAGPPPVVLAVGAKRSHASSLTSRNEDFQPAPGSPEPSSLTREVDAGVHPARGAAAATKEGKGDALMCNCAAARAGGTRRRCMNDRSPAWIAPVLRMLAETGVDSAKAVVPKLLRYRRDTVACHATGCDDCMVRACVECSPTELWLCQECAAQPGVELATEVRGQYGSCGQHAAGAPCGEKTLCVPCAQRHDERARLHAETARGPPPAPIVMPPDRDVNQLAAMLHAYERERGVTLALKPLCRTCDEWVEEWRAYATGLCKCEYEPAPAGSTALGAPCKRQCCPARRGANDEKAAANDENGGGGE